MRFGMEKSLSVSNLALNEPLVFERGSPGRTAYSFDDEENIGDEKSISIPSPMLREPIRDFVELSEVDIVRHFTRISQWNYGVDTGLYPLGSCTMKYNPKVNEEAARMPGFAGLHPYQPDYLSQGALQLMYELEGFLSEVTGMDRVTLQPAAGAHGELTGMLIIRAYFAHRGKQRTKVLVPDTAHGTNPASISMCGYRAVPVKSNASGIINTDSVVSLMDEGVAAIMMTNPNTLGIFESNIKEIASVVHAKGGIVYCDGANLNALMGTVKIGDLGVDMVHINLHKTFSTPHGGGGPGAGPLAVKERFAPFLPLPFIRKKNGMFRLEYSGPESIGKVRSFYSNFLICVRAYAYILSMGGRGLKRASTTAVVNANYIRSKLKKYFYLPYEVPCMHECVFTDKKQQEHHVTTLDIAKRLIDYGFHPPTIYFPLVVNGALMIEPTETEGKESLDQFIEAMISIAREAESSPELLKNAPVRARITRVNEVAAARYPVLRWNPKAEDGDRQSNTK
jgi:glycine dehydrogenase subunit 2